MKEERVVLTAKQVTQYQKHFGDIVISTSHILVKETLGKDDITCDNPSVHIITCSSGAFGVVSRGILGGDSVNVAVAIKSAKSGSQNNSKHTV